MPGNHSYAHLPTHGDALRHAPAVLDKPASVRPRSSFLDKANSLRLVHKPDVSSKAAAFFSAPAPGAAPPPPSPGHSSRPSRCPSPAHPLPAQALIYGRPPPPRRSRPSPAFVPRHSAASSSPAFLPVTAVCQASNRSTAPSCALPLPSTSSHALSPPPRSRQRPSSTLVTVPPPPPPQPPRPCNARSPPSLPPPPLHRTATTHSPSPPPYSFKLASTRDSTSHSLAPSSATAANMVSFGRVVCVALPFVLAVISIVALLVATLAGVADKHTYMFEVNTTGLSVSPTDAVSILEGRTVVLDSRAPAVAAALDTHAPAAKVERATISASSNITAADLDLGKLYDIALWNYCVTEQNGTRTCTKPEFNWAAKTLNGTENSLNTLISSTGVSLTIPKDIRNAISVFGTLVRWTQIVFLIAFGALALEILFGLFTSCSRGVSCVTFLIATITVVAVVGAAGMATATSIIVVAAIEASAKKYGVTASVHSGFLAAVWISAAAAIAASFFWMFTVCCCSPERRSRSGMGSARHLDNKEGPVGSYQPLNDLNQNRAYYNNNNANAFAPQYGAPRYPQAGRSDLAYEPYTHSHA